MTPVAAVPHQVVSVVMGVVLAICVVRLILFGIVTTSILQFVFRTKLIHVVMLEAVAFAATLKPHIHVVGSKEGLTIAIVYRMGLRVAHKNKSRKVLINFVQR